MLVTDRPEGLLATIRSRCQRVDFAYAPPARSPAVESLRSAFSNVASRIDGRGATTVELVEGLETALDAAGSASELAAAAELEELNEQIEARGYQPRTAASLRKRLAERQRQELRRARTDGLIEGIGAMEQVYLDALAGAPRALNVRPDRASDAIDVCRAARQADEFNPNVGSLLLRLVSHLPATV